MNISDRDYELAIRAAETQLDKLRSECGAPTVQQFAEALEELSTCIEEMCAGLEELRSQNEMLVDSTRKLEIEQKHYKEIFEFAPGGYLVTDLKGNIEAANQHAAKLLGVPADFLTGKPLILFFDQEAREAFMRRLSVRAGKNLSETRLWRTRMQPRNGNVFDAAVTESTMLDIKNRPTGIRWLVRDISEVKRAEEQLERSQNRLRAFARKLQDIREEEQAKIARELHDEVGASLTALKLELSLLTSNPEDKSLVREKGKAMMELVDITIAEVQNLASGLRPRVLDHFGLIAAMEWQINAFRKRTGTICKVNLPENVSLDPEQSTAVFRILQEALTNVARHAYATRIEVTLKIAGQMLLLEVADDGMGIEEAALSSPVSFGLLGMQERAAAFAGEVEIERALGNHGTRVKLRMPVKSA
jgi:PAS domain S-box-containing protein